MILIEECVRSGVGLEGVTAVLRNLMQNGTPYRSVWAAQIAVDVIPEEAVPVLHRRLLPWKDAKGRVHIQGSVSSELVSALGRAGKHAKATIPELERLKGMTEYAHLRQEIRETLKKTRAAVKKN